jgi:hypothetical protein
VCKRKKKYEEDIDGVTFVQELLGIVSAGSEVMGKETRLKVLNIYLLIEIARKPLKGYY